MPKATRNPDGTVREMVVLAFGVEGIPVRVRFAELDGRLECVRIEVGMELDRQGGPEPKPVPASVLRGVPFAEKVREAGASYLKSLEDAGRLKLMAAQRRELRDRRARAGTTVRRGRLGREHFQEVARVYEEAANARLPTTKAVALHFQVANQTAANWIGRARNEYHLLPKTRPGVAKARRRGGRRP